MVHFVNTTELESTVAGPIQLIGMSYYFDPATAAHGKEHGLNVFEFYGIGRAGVLGDVEVGDVVDAFWFFHENTINGLYGVVREKIDVDTGANEHIKAAYAYADRVFAQVPESTLRGFADAAHKVIDHVPQGLYPLVDGYRNFAVPSEAAHAAKLGSILLRELRGAVHIAATQEFGIAANEACFISNEMIFKMHGYSDADAPERTEDLETRMAEAEARTTEIMAKYLEVLSDDERVALAHGVAAMNEAVTASPGA
jgi:hypothetical protein